MSYVSHVLLRVFKCLSFVIVAPDRSTASGVADIRINKIQQYTPKSDRVGSIVTKLSQATTIHDKQENTRFTLE